MHLRAPASRGRRRLAVFLLLASMASLAGSVAVGALEGESFRVREGSPGGGTYGPILTSDPATVTVDGSLVTPEECKVMTSCLTIPFEVVVPANLKETDDFFVNLVVGWEDPEHLSDIDIFVWDDGQQAVEEAEAAGEEPPEGKTYTVQTDSASSANPEIARLFKPSYGQYHVVIFNFLGPPIEVNVAGEMVAARYSTPFELLAPEAAAPASSPERAAINPDRPTAASSPAAAPSGPRSSGPPPALDASLPEIDPETDADFTDFDDPEFDDALAPELSEADQLALANLADSLAASSSPPSAASLLLALVAAPLLFAAAAGAWFWRRSPGAIDFD